MKKIISRLTAVILFALITGCAGIKYITVETQEPAQVTLPYNVKSVLIVNNVVQQPDEIGHNTLKVGFKDAERAKASSDSIAIYYTEALSQFLGEEDYFASVMYNKSPLREDKDFWKEQPLTPEKMNALKKKSGADAIISLDKLILQTDKREHFKQEGYSYADLEAKIHSIIRIYLPTMDGKMPSVQYRDSLRWEGYDTQERKVYTDLVLPSREKAVKELAVRAAEKMTATFSPHWIMQDRWYYTLSNSLMKEGATLAQNMQWKEAAVKWEEYFSQEKDKQKQAKAANNIALAYEMLGDMNSAYQWVSKSYELFEQSVTTNSLEIRRLRLYKNEITRRRDNTNKLNMQMN